jgi:hypothetical protein
MTLSKDAKDRVLSEVAFMVGQKALRPKQSAQQKLEELKSLKEEVKQHLSE